MSLADVLGVSYYPFYDAKGSTLENLKTNLDNMAKTYKKPIVIAETDWPIKCSKAAGNIPTSLMSIPFSGNGQVLWIKKIADIVKAVPNGLGQGIMYWEPGWIDNANLGSKCESGGPLFDGDWSKSSHAVAKGLS